MPGQYHNIVNRSFTTEFEIVELITLLFVQYTLYFSLKCLRYTDDSNHCPRTPGKIKQTVFLHVISRSSISLSRMSIKIIFHIPKDSRSLLR